MNRRVRILLALLVLCLGFAAWQWLRPYEWSPDSEARAKISFSRIERDESFFWLDVYVKITDPRGHDLEKPVRLILSDGQELEPADTTLEGSEKQKIEAISFRFWLDSTSIVGPLQLQMNDGNLLVRKKAIVPDLKPRAFSFHQTTNW
ncbi:hypothetical protein [Haloferula sp.]|uniref:hypothetical protein n=1 Tax=Haloferula sp. TaxID=2497595 RepID=UPI00329B6057